MCQRITEDLSEPRYAVEGWGGMSKSAVAAKLQTLYNGQGEECALDSFPVGDRGTAVFRTDQWTDVLWIRRLS